MRNLELFFVVIPALVGLVMIHEIAGYSGNSEDERFCKNVDGENFYKVPHVDWFSCLTMSSLSMTEYTYVCCMPVDVEVSVNKKSLSLKWSIPPPPASTPERLTVTGFEVCLISEQSQCVQVNKTDVMWSNLHSSTNYNLTIQVLIADKKGARSEMIQVTTAAEDDSSSSEEEEKENLRFSGTAQVVVFLVGTVIGVTLLLIYIKKCRINEKVSIPRYITDSGDVEYRLLTPPDMYRVCSRRSSAGDSVSPMVSTV